MSDTALEEPPLAQGERTHPLGLFVGFITGLPQLFFPILAALFGTGARDNPIWIPLIILAVMLVSLLFRWIGWLRFRFLLDGDDIRIEQGILNRTVRSIPYDRIQDVSIEEKPLARLFGLGEVKFETGGGEGEDAKLSFVSMERAAALRETVRVRKAQVMEQDVVLADEGMAEPNPIFAMDNDRLLTLGFYSFSLIIFAVLGGLAQQFDFLLPFDWWDLKRWVGLVEDRGVSVDGIGVGAGIAGGLFALAVLAAIGVATGIIRTVLRDYGFRLDLNERGFRRRRGFLTRTDVVMPVNRVQAAAIVTGPIRKRRGWHALKFISLAQDSKEEADFMAAPLARLDEIWPIMTDAGIEPMTDNATLQRGAFRWWLGGFLIVIPMTFAAMAAVILFADSSFAKALLLLFIPAALLVSGFLEWRVYRYGMDGRQLCLRAGWWRQRFEIAPQIKVQSAEIRQGPMARMLGLCTLHFGIAGGELAFQALPLDEAHMIRDTVMAIAAPVDFSNS